MNDIIPLQRAIQGEFENAIATKLLENTFVERDTIVIYCVDNVLTFNKKAFIKVSEPQTVL